MSYLQGAKKRVSPPRRKFPRLEEVSAVQPASSSGSRTGSSQPEPAIRQQTEQEEVRILNNTDDVHRVSSNDRLFGTFVDQTLDKARKDVQEFEAGRLADYLPIWKTVTSDFEILRTVSGYHIDFESEPFQWKEPKVIQFSNNETIAIDKEIEKLLRKKIIALATVQEVRDGFVSNIFIRPKPDNTFRVILNLTQLNKHVRFAHFKMDTLQSVIQLMKPGCMMASLDIKDAYHSVKVAEEHQKYLIFKWNNRYYKFTCFPNGLSPCPRLFTKILKPVMANLRGKGYICLGYIDDFYHQGKDISECRQNIMDSVKILTDLGFVIHPEKSVLEPSTKIKFLGFILDSSEMVVRLPEDKADNVIDLCRKLLRKSRPSIREVAGLIGHLVSITAAVVMAPLFYKQLELEKSAALIASKGNFDSKMCYLTWRNQISNGG